MKIYDIFPIALSILTVFCISCTKQSDALDAALAKAGNNQEEIQKVLDYFRKDTKDSLKYKAALFLIENMPGYATYSHDSINSSFQPRKELPYDKSR